MSDQANPPLTRLIHEVPNAKVRIEAVVLENGSCPAEEFLEELDEVDTQKMKALFDLFIRSRPRPLSREKFKKIEGTDDLFEFKNFQIRMPCFFKPGGRLLLTHGLIKKGDKLSTPEIDKAKKIKAILEKREGAHG